jgi:hypothetical protein
MACAMVNVACGVLSPEEQLLTDFFAASRVYDTAVMARLSDVPLNPRTDGIVDSFEIERVDRADDTRERAIIAARVRSFDGQVRSRQMVFTLTRRDSRWFIHEWAGTP